MSFDQASVAVRSSRGFTLTELMIGLTLGIILIGGMVIVFNNVSKGFRQDEQASRLHDDLRSAFALMAEDVEMAGFWGDLHNPYVSVVLDCNVFGPGTYTREASGNCVSSTAAPTASNAAALLWAFFNRAPIAAANNYDEGTGTATLLTSAVTPDAADPETISLADLGFDDGEVRPNTDIIAIKRVLGGRVEDAPSAGSTDPATSQWTDSDVNNVFLQSGTGSTGTLFRVTAVNTSQPATPGKATPAPNPTVTGATSDYRYRVAIYYIRNYETTDAGAQNIPTLCRKILQGGTPITLTTECLSQGVENLQVEYGVDTVPAAGDGIVDQYVAADPTNVVDPTQAQLGKVIAIRISLLGRNQPGAKNELDRSYSNAKTYTFGDVTVSGNNDPYYRKLLQGVVLVRNPASLDALSR